MSEKTRRSLVDELREAVRKSGARMHFWVCPLGCNGRVTWAPDCSDATCEVCGTKKSENIPYPEETP
jgi:hypothetical protein